MVEQIRDLGVGAHVAEVPVAAAEALLAQRAHGVAAGRVAHLGGDRVVVHRDEPVQEDEHAHDRRRDEPAGVEAEPGEVEGDLLAKVLAHVAQRLVLWPARPLGPVEVENLARVELFVVGSAVVRAL